MTSLKYYEHNPVPDAHKDGLVETPDGFHIRYAIFRCKAGTTKGTIVLMQGRNESIEKYFETVGDLVARDFDVITFDWRGQGGSTRFFTDPEPGYIEHFDQYATDLETVFGEVVLPDCRPPYFAVAHSMGGLIALYTAPAMTNRIRRMVLNAPFLGLGGPPSRTRFLRWALPVLIFCGLGNIYLTGGPARKARKPFEINPLTSDRRRFDRNRKIVEDEPGLALGGPTAQWMSAAFRAIRKVRDPDHMANTTIPTLVVMSGADTVVSNAAIEQHVLNLRSGYLLTIDGARHETMQEADRFREQFLAAVNAFLPGS